MTYWPFASPSVFSATKRTLAGRVQTSHDGAEPKGQEPHHGSTPDESSRSSSADSTEQKEGDESVRRGTREAEEKAPAERRPSQHHDTAHRAEDDVSGEIIAIRVSRSGHMFATVTRTTLTIWQTKARFPRLSLYIP